ncbi:MAG: HD domain-containing protein [Chitinivibrionales bacterium]
MPIRKVFPAFDEALGLLNKYNLTPSRIKHSIGVAKTARALARRVIRRNPQVSISPERVEIAALLHDIGRGIKGDHEANSMKILKKEGYPQLVPLVRHGTHYEARKIRGIDDPSTLPCGLENKIVAYADTRYRLAPVTLQQRLEEIRRRRGGDGEKMQALQMAMPRILALEKEVLDLAGLSETDEIGVDGR